MVSILQKFDTQMARALCGDSAATQKLIDSAINPTGQQTIYLRGLNYLRAGKGREADRAIPPPSATTSASGTRDGETA